MNSVPEAYLGVWQRTLLRTADGREDRSTQVFWLQTAQGHADIRVPQRDPLTLLQRVSQAGFAGITQVQGDRCQWHRLIDFHPAGRVDIGIMHFVTPDEVHETAPDRSYLEVWKRLPGSMQSNQTIWLATEENPSRQACLLRAGDWFIFAADRQQSLQAGVALEDQLKGLAADKADALLGCELSFGRITGDVPWTISLSTLPGRSGKCLSAEALADDIQCWTDAQLQYLGSYPPRSGWQRTAQPVVNFPALEGTA
ncbi:MAG: hypothetical protein R6V43_14760 [Halopseudomonas sp.]